MAINSFGTYAKQLCNLFVVLTHGKGLQNFNFTIRQVIIFLSIFYRGLRRFTDNTPTIGYSKNIFTHDFRRRVFDKQSIYAGIVKLLEQGSCRNTRYNGKTRLRRPALGLQKYFQTVCARHAQIQKRAIGLFFLDQRNGFNAVTGRADEGKFGDLANNSFHAFGYERMVISNNDSLAQKIRHHLRHTLKLFFFLAIVLFYSSAAFSENGDTTFKEIKGPVSISDVTANTDYYLDPDWAMTLEDILASPKDLFGRITTSEPDFGYISEKVWLRSRFKNGTTDNANWRLYVRENFFQYYDVYVVRSDGRIDHIESHDPQTVYSDRIIPYPELVSPIRFLPGETITLYVSYWSGGSSNAAMSFETQTSLGKLAVGRTSKNYVSYGMMAILIFASGIALIFLRLPVLLAYLTYIALTLLYLMHSDGVTFQYFWPEFPGFNSYFTIIIGIPFAMASFNFARLFLQTKIYHPIMNKVIWTFIIITPALAIPGAFIDPQLTKQSLFPVMMASAIVGTFTGLLAARTRFKAVRFYLFAWIFAFGTASMVNMRHVFGVDIAQDMELDGLRMTVVVDAVMMGLSIVDHYRQVQISRRHATEQSLHDARRNLKLNNRLYDIEEQYKLAVELAASQDEHIKNTIHDLRQPLHALRINVQKLRQSQTTNEADKTKIDDMFSYLETLISDQLKDTVGTTNPIQNPTKPFSQSSDTDLSLNRILESIHEMFLPDAKAKNLEFRYVKTTQTSDIDPLIIMRIVTNLVANAIKYTPSGKILLGTRRQSHGLKIEVHDTGIGMSEEEFSEAKNRFVRLQKQNLKVEGQGYGLAIASDLVKENGLKLYSDSNRRTGTGIILEIPK